MNFISEFLEAWSQRVRSPILGSVLISFLIVNWQPIWYLIFADRPVRNKFIYFDTNTNIFTIFVYPVIIGLSLAIFVPWIRLFGAHLVRGPLKKLRKLEDGEAQEQKLHKLELSAREIEVQARLDEAKEMAKIAAARRLDEARQVGGKDLEEELISSRDETDESDTLQLPAPPQALPKPNEPSNGALELLKLIATQPEGTFFLGAQGSEYSFGIGLGATDNISRREYLVISANVNELRDLGLLEERSDAVSLAGYDFLERLS